MMENMVEIKDITDGLIKSLCFGVIVIGSAVTKLLYQARRGGLSRAPRPLVMSSTLVLVWDYFLDTLMI
jgi:ABC-type transporter Mla maintaining outer membrane lipid asymmetry permease subunit MlaE